MVRLILFYTAVPLFFCLSVLSNGLTAQILLAPSQKAGTGSTLLLPGQGNSASMALGAGGSSSLFLGPGSNSMPGTLTIPGGGIQVGGNIYPQYQLPLSTPNTLTAPGRPDYLAPAAPLSSVIQLPSGTIRVSPGGQSMGNEMDQKQQESIARSILKDLIGASETSPSVSTLPETNVETPIVIKNAPKTSVTILTEPETDDERIDRELLNQRLEAEKIADPTQKGKALDEIKRQEEARKRWLDQRQAIEQGADFFLAPKLKEKMLKEGWCQLFDGRTGFGWQTPKTGYYSGGVFTFGEDGIQSVPQYPGLLYTTNQFGDFSLRFDYQTDPDAEVLLLLKTTPTPKDLYSSCYTVVLNSGKPDRPRGLILGRQHYTPEELQSLTEIQQRNEARADSSGQTWHSLMVKIDRSQINVWVDRQEPVVFLDPKPIASGYVGLLVAKGNARFQNVLWQPGAPLPVFNQLNEKKNGWHTESDVVKFARSQAETYRLSGGPGSVETAEIYDNFVLQLEYYNGMTSSRSSLFFRSIPQQYRSGYEISLQNFPTRQDRDSMVGVDAGSFRDIKDARYVRPLDREWNFLTLVAEGRHFQTWINGVPVCEITDSRKVKEENSKEGPFLNAGTLQFYAPLEGSVVQYRNIKIAPIPERNEQKR